MSRSQRTAALQIPVSFQYRRPNIRGHASPSNITNYSNGHLSAGAHCRNRSNSTDLEAGGSLSLHFGTGSHSDEAESIDQSGESSLRSERSGYLTASGRSMQPCLEESAFPPLPGSRIAKRKTKQRTRGPLVPADGALGGNESRGSSTSASQSHLHGRIEDKSGSNSNRTVCLPNQWQRSPGREMRSEGVVNVIHTASAVNRRNSRLVNEDGDHGKLPVSENRDHGKLPVSEAPVVGGLDNGFKLTDEVRIANKALSDCIRSRLGDNEKLFMAFKDVSAQFRKGKLDARLYCKHITSLGLWDLVPELARLCPDPERQRNLLNAYEEGSKEKQPIASKEGHLQLERMFNPDELGKDAKKAEASELTSVRSTMDAARRLTDRGGTSTENNNGGVLSRDKYCELKGKQRAESSVSKPLSSLGSSSENGAHNKLLVNGSVHGDFPSQSTSTKMWSCNVCTLENSDLDSECAACGTSCPQTSCPDAVAQCNGKRTKKISKFERLRLDHDAPPQPPPPPVQTREPAQKMRGGGAWNNRGGQRIVAMAQREDVITDAWRRS